MDSAADAVPSKRTAVVVIHGVGHTSTGWINPSVVDPIADHEIALKCVSHSELHSLAQAGAGDTKFTTLVRRASVGRNDVVFIEMFWADLSRVAEGSLSYLMATLNLAFIAPGVLAQAFLRRRWRGLHALIALLIVASSRLLSWFIVGLNVTVIACAAFVATIWWLQGSHVLPVTWLYDTRTIAVWLLVPTTALFVFGVYTYRSARATDIGWSQFALGLALSSGAILLYALAANFAAYWDYNPCANREIWLCDAVSEWKKQPDFDNGRDTVFFVWIVWCITTLTAVALLLLVHLARFIGWRTSKAIPLRAAWTAIFTILVQAVILKMLITPLSILACTQLKEAYVSARSARENADDRTDLKQQIVRDSQSICDVDKSSGVFSFTVFETVFLVLGLIYLFAARRRASEGNDVEDMPRLIVHPLLTALAVVTVTSHIIVFAEHIIISGKSIAATYGALPGWKKSLLPLLFFEAHTWGLPTVAGYDRLPASLKAGLVLLVPIYFFILRFFHDALRPAIHIARQIVDHQYRATPATLSRFRSPTEAWAGYPRRQMIASRLNAIMRELLHRQKFDRLVFLTHSQGSVVMFDYLRSSEGNELLEEVGEIHVVTMGSPLTHIYAEYFAEYANPIPAQNLRGNVRSWLNFHRIDDPIGNKVQVVAGLIENRLLGRGGHVNYWREKAVQDHLCSLIEIPAANAKYPTSV